MNTLYYTTVRSLHASFVASDKKTVISFERNGLQFQVQKVVSHCDPFSVVVTPVAWPDWEPECYVLPGSFCVWRHTSESPSS